MRLESRGAGGDGVVPDSRLFWFLREGVRLDLSDPSILDMYVQQVMTRGNMGDVRKMLARVNLQKMRDSLGRLRRFLPREIRMFWEDFVAGH